MTPTTSLGSSPHHQSHHPHAHFSSSLGRATSSHTCSQLQPCWKGHFREISVIPRQVHHEILDLITHVVLLWESDSRAADCSEPTSSFDRCLGSGHSAQGDPAARQIPPSPQVPLKGEGTCLGDLAGSSHSLQGHSLATDISAMLLLQALSTSANTSLLSQGFSIPFPGITWLGETQISLFCKENAKSFWVHRNAAGINLTA